MYKEITHNGKYRYVQSYKDLDGKTRRVSVVKNNKTRTTEKEAYNELQEKIEKLLNPEVVNKPLGFYKEKFLEFKKATLTHHSYLIYKSYLQKLDDNEKLENITKIKYDKMIIEYRSHYSPEAIKFIVRLFNNLFKFIKKYYVKSFDVTLEFKLTKEEKAEKLQKIKYLEKDEISNILANIENNTVRNVAIVQLHTGLRIGEVLALTPKDIDFDNKTISVNKTKLQNGKLSAPKTLSSIRTIEVSDYVLSIIYDFISSDEFIFKVHYNTIINHLTLQNITSHMFRHTHVALLIEAGVPIKVISERLGHSDTSITLSIYTHVTANMKVDLHNKLEKAFPIFSL
ncbi:site-specific integrase [Gemella sanguinis]|jgi:integrase|nr:site-specific integrase [Gemella sanguinis]DAI30033.1 MAG TPA: Integrase [Caudoviricetes sp.]DAN01419.1 MAG TPA: Integrase [Caudoviricetes sp.]